MNDDDDDTIRKINVTTQWTVYKTRKVIQYTHNYNMLYRVIHISTQRGDDWHDVFFFGVIAIWSRSEKM